MLQVFGKVCSERGYVWSRLEAYVVAAWGLFFVAVDWARLRARGAGVFVVFFGMFYALLVALWYKVAGLVAGALVGGFLR